MRSSLLAIHLRPRRRAPVQTVADASIEAGLGLLGDHRRQAGGRRQVTVVFADQLAAAEAKLGRPISPALTRRNLLLSGAAELTEGDLVRVGEAQLEITGPCDPCERMDEAFGPGAIAALDGLAGYTARVLVGGHLSIGALATRDLPR